MYAPRVFIINRHANWIELSHEYFFRREDPVPYIPMRHHERSIPSYMKVIYIFQTLRAKEDRHGGYANSKAIRASSQIMDHR